jgi:GntR family transcriptional regulator
VVIAVTHRPESAYRTVTRDLQSKIAQGVYDNGRRLPTEAELAAEYNVSRQTIRRAFQDLVAGDMVYRVPGRGTFAKSNGEGYIRQFGSIDDLMGLSEDTVMRVVDPLSRHVDLGSASRLRLDADTVFRMQFVRLHERTPFCTTTVYLPPTVGRTLTAVGELTACGATSTSTVIGLLDDRWQTPILEAQQSITVDHADEVQALHLGCPAGHSLLRIDRLYLDAEDRPVELAISHFLPEHYSYRIRLRRNS